MNDYTKIFEIITSIAISDVLDYEEKLKRNRFNCKNLPLKTIRAFESGDEVETWQKYGIPYYIRDTHGGMASPSLNEMLNSRKLVVDLFVELKLRRLWRTNKGIFN